MKCDVFLIFVCSSRVPRPRYTGDNYGEAHYTRKVRKYTRHDNFFLLLSHVVRYRRRCCSPPPKNKYPVLFPPLSFLWPPPPSKPPVLRNSHAPVAAAAAPSPAPPCSSTSSFLSGLVFGAERAQGKGERGGEARERGREATRWN